jgi:hypothetical protein
MVADQPARRRDWRDQARDQLELVVLEEMGSVTPAGRLPDFLIIGAAKSGTTSLHRALKQHPEVFLSPYKEPNYFALAGRTLPEPGPVAPEVLYQLIHAHSVTAYDRYLALFEAAPHDGVVGEASVRYLYYSDAADRIRRQLPDVRLIAILREPVSRLYSHYCMNVQYQLEPLSLMDALGVEESRTHQGWGWDWHYVAVSRYGEQLQRYFERFDREQIRVFLYDDFVERPLEVFREVCRHLGIAQNVIPDMTKREKPAYRGRNLALDRWLHWPNPARAAIASILPRRLMAAAVTGLERWNSAPVPRLDPHLRAEISGLFKDDIRLLEQLLGRTIRWYV